MANVPKKNCSADAKWRRNRNQIADEFLDDVVFFLPRFFFAVFPSFFLRSATLSLATRWSLGFGFFLFAINFRDAIFLRGVSFSFWRFFWGFFFADSAVGRVFQYPFRWATVIYFSPTFHRRLRPLQRANLFIDSLGFSLSLPLLDLRLYNETEEDREPLFLFQRDFNESTMITTSWVCLVKVHQVRWWKQKKIQTLKTKTVKKKKCFQIDPFLFSSGPLVHWLTSEGNLRAATSSRQVFFSSSPPKPIDR